MIKHWTLFLACFLFFSTSSAQEITWEYSTLWQHVYHHELDGNTKVALKVVDSIYRKTTLDNNAVQRIKSLLYKGKFLQLIEEDSQQKVLDLWTQEIDSFQEPYRNIMNVILAKTYDSYLYKHRYKLRKRTRLKDSLYSSTIYQMTKQELEAKVDSLYKASLAFSEGEAKKMEILLFQDILNGEKENYLFEPSILSFLLEESLGYYGIKNLHGQRKKTTSDLLKSNFSYEAFLSMMESFTFYNKDESVKSVLNQVFREDLSFYTKEKLLLNVLREIHSSGHFNRCFSEDYVSLLKERYPKEKALDPVFYLAIAEEMVAAAKRTEQTEDDALAFAYCDDLWKQFSDEDMKERLDALKKGLFYQSLYVKQQEYIPSNRPSKMLLKHRNISSVNYRVYKVANDLYQRHSMNQLERMADSLLVGSLHQVDSKKIALQDTKDFMEESTELLFPALALGTYKIVFDAEGIVVEQWIQVTDLLVVEAELNNEQSYTVLNRWTGKPEKGVALVLKGKNSKEEIRTIHEKKTDKYGKVSYLSRDTYYNISTSFHKDGDYLSYDGGNQYPYYKRNQKEDKEEILIVPNVFTDRAIYRPGQEVFYKVLVLQSQNDKTSVFDKQYISISITDSFGKEVEYKEVKLSDYGSYSDSFVLPISGGTGEYSIEIEESYDVGTDFYDTADYDFDYRDFEFRVEEYKRPTFSAKMDSFTETYRFNDSIQVKGTAKSFTGKSISDATVSYTVDAFYRAPSSPYYSTEEKRVKIGEVPTKADGSFSFVFPANAIEGISIDKQPIVRYKIKVSVEDATGETQEASTVVRVGNTLLEASISMPALWRQGTASDLILSLQSLNGQPQEKEGELFVYRLKESTLLRKRDWDFPDHQQISKEMHHRFFPLEAYEKDTLKKEQLVLSKNILATEKRISLKEILQEAKPGNYRLDYQVKDKNGQIVSASESFKILPNKGAYISKENLVSLDVEKNKKGVQITVSSPLEESYVQVVLSSEGKVIKEESMYLTKQSKSFFYPKSLFGEENIVIDYYYAIENYFEKKQARISGFQKMEGVLEITTKTFIDKLNPAEQSTWEIQITSDKKDRQVSELLVSMYDASLDAFTNHEWKTRDFDNYSYYDSYYLQFKGFQLQSDGSNTQLYYPFNSYLTEEVSIDWMGFDINTFHQRQDYLNKVNRIQEAYHANAKKSLDSLKPGMISGVVQDTDGPLPTVNIINLRTKATTTTDFDGIYSIAAKKGDVLQFNYIGYQTVQKKIIGKGQISVRLELDDVLEEVVILAHSGTSTKNKSTYATSITSIESKSELQMLQGQVSGLNITYANGQPGSSPKIVLRGMSSFIGDNKPLYVVDGVPIDGAYQVLDSGTIASISVLKDTAATALYGSRGASGVIIVQTKKGLEESKAELAAVKVRKNLQETAFFYPALKTDKKGTIRFQFTNPEALGEWKMNFLAHNKKGEIGQYQKKLVVTKNLMIQPNVPRFFRQGDSISFKAKITSLQEEVLEGKAQLYLNDPVSGKELGKAFAQLEDPLSFRIAAKGSTVVTWKLYIPEGVEAVQYKVVAQAGDFSDGQQDLIPVLSNRILLTESLPLQLRKKGSKSFRLEKLLADNSSTSKHHSLRLELSTDPIWNAIQSLPYLMEYPYECAEQTFARLYANSLGGHIIKSNPKIKTVLQKWADKEVALSHLEKNQELKNMLLEESPWLREAKNEEAQRKRIGMLFESQKMQDASLVTLRKLKAMQHDSGGFGWFAGGKYLNRYISQHILAGFGHLEQLGVVSNKEQDQIREQLVAYLDKILLKQYQKLLKGAKAGEILRGIPVETFLQKEHLSSSDVQYLYARSFYSDAIPEDIAPVLDYYHQQSKDYWIGFPLGLKAMIALVHMRKGDTVFAKKIIASLEQNSVESETLGTYWKENRASWFWYQAPIETQALLLEAFDEISPNSKSIEGIRFWLLQHKQTHQWETTKATTEAIYALLKTRKKSLEQTNRVSVSIGGKPLELEAATGLDAQRGYLQKQWASEEIDATMGEVQLSQEEDAPVFGALYWQYFEDLDKVSAASTSLKIEKKLFRKVEGSNGTSLVPIPAQSSIALGDLLTVRMVLSTDRDLEFVHLKDGRASGLEPVSVLSKYHWKEGMYYYQSTRDASTNFFFEALRKGVYVLEYDVRVNNVGNFSTGIATVESMYAPSFRSHSTGERMRVVGKD